MAGLYGRAIIGPTGALAASQSYIVAVGTAPANHRILVPSVLVAFRGTGAADPPPLIEFGIVTGAAGTSVSPIKVFSTDDETLQSTWLHTATVTWGTTLFWDLLHIQTSRTFLFPKGTEREMPIPGGTSWAIRITMGSGVTASPTVYVVPNFEE